MKCATLTQSSSFPSPDRTNLNRITFSKLTQYEVADYAAPTFSIKYVVKGLENYFIDHTHFRVSAGNFLLVNQDTGIDGYVRSKHAVEGFCIHLRKDFLEDIFSYHTHSEEALLDNPTVKTIVPSFRPLLHCDKDSGLGQLLATLPYQFDHSSRSLLWDETEIYHRLTHQLLLLPGSRTFPREQLPVRKQRTRAELLKRVSLAKEIMDAGLDEHLDVANIAARAMLSVTHFNRSFRHIYQLSPHQYLLKKRMEQATRLLKNKDLLIGDIGLACGYPDPAVFSKAFKKLYGVSPVQMKG